MKKLYRTHQSVTLNKCKEIIDKQDIYSSSSVVSLLDTPNHLLISNHYWLYRRITRNNFDVQWILHYIPTRDINFVRLTEWTDEKDIIKELHPFLHLSDGDDLGTAILNGRLITTLYYHSCVVYEQNGDFYYSFSGLKKGGKWCVVSSLCKTISYPFKKENLLNFMKDIFSEGNIMVQSNEQRLLGIENPILYNKIFPGDDLDFSQIYFEEYGSEDFWYIEQFLSLKEIDEKNKKLLEDAKLSK